MTGIEPNAFRHVLAAVLALLFCGATLAGTAEPADPEGSPASGAASARVLGVELTFDRATGRLVSPTPEIVQQLRAALASTYAATRESQGAATFADGTRSFVLDERHATFSIAWTDAEGRVSTRCVAGAGNAEAVLSDTAAAAQREEE